MSTEQPACLALFFAPTHEIAAKIGAPEPEREHCKDERITHRARSRIAIPFSTHIDMAPRDARQIAGLPSDCKA
jgi:hypothetical protein